jgi:hypothetical protein
MNEGGYWPIARFFIKNRKILGKCSREKKRERKTQLSEIRQHIFKALKKPS